MSVVEMPVVSLTGQPVVSVLPSSRLQEAPTLGSQDLLQGCREVIIRHGGESYRLRHTRNDKLILTK